MKALVICLLILFTFSGCGTREFVQTMEAQESEAYVEVPGSWVVYKNEQYGYSFSYPKEAILFSDLTDNLEIVPAGSHDPLVMLTDASEYMLLNAEVNTLAVRVVKNARSAHEWISQNLEVFYPQGVAGQTSGRFAGEQAIILRGTGSTNSPEKVVVFQRGDAVFVISFGQESITFNEVLETFSL